MIKAVFFDIDGTLVSFKTHEISSGVMTALYELKRKGVRLFISSGRHRLLMDNLGDFPFDGYVCMNGASVEMDGRIVSSTFMDSRTAEKIVERCRQYGFPLFVFGPDSCGITARNECTDAAAEMIRLPAVPMISIDGIDTGKVCQFTVFADERQEKEELLPGISEVAVSRWFPAFLDVNPAGLSKADGIASVISALGISVEETMAFGDGGNDVEMLDYAGTGIAMGNASDSVKSHADYVTSTVDEDGVVAALRHFGML